MSILRGTPRIAKITLLLGLAHVLLIAMFVAPASSLAKGGTIDYGDAADGAKYGFAKKKGKRPTGFFPSKAATPGPRHTAIGSFFLGAGVDGEADSAQVDKDLFDDGVEADLTACKASTLEVGLNGAALPASTRTAAHTAYVNAWFDWNGDGDFADPTDGCRAEWAVQNLPINMSTLAGSGSELLPVDLDAGKQTERIFMRVTLTLDEPVVSPTGRGGLTPYTQGETEDYLLPPTKGPRILLPKGKPKKPPPLKKNGPFSVSCDPPLAVAVHGTTATIKFVIKDFGSGFINGEVTKKPKGGGVRLNPAKPQPKGVPPGFKKIDGFSVSSTKDPPTRFEFKLVSFKFTRGKRSQTLTCGATIIHNSGPGALPKVPCRNNPCAGTLAIPPPVPPGQLPVAGWMPVPIELRQLQLQSVPNVTEFRLPLLAQQPPWPTGALAGSDDPQLVGCALGTVSPQGGQAALVCTRNNTQINPTRNYNINAGIPATPGVPIVGQITLNGQPFSFSAPG